MGKNKKVESAEVLLPDYYFSVKAMEEYGYKKGTMYPLHRDKATVLYSLGLKIYRLYSDNEDEEVKRSPVIFLADTMFGVKKDDWLDFIKTDQGLAYIYAWNDVLNAAQQVRIDREMSLGDFTSEFYEELYWSESFAIESFLNERVKQFGETPDEIYESARDKTLLAAICDEYAERMKEAFWELTGGKLTASDFFTDIVEEVALQRYKEDS